jgi:hypothetical protein
MPNADFDYGVSHIVPAIKVAIIAGGSAGALTVTGITTKDTLLAVNSFGFDTDGDVVSASSVNMLSETSISDDDEITTTTTDTTDLAVLVMWVSAATGA